MHTATSTRSGCRQRGSAVEGKNDETPGVCVCVPRPHSPTPPTAPHHVYSTYASPPHPIHHRRLTRRYSRPAPSSSLLTFSLSRPFFGMPISRFCGAKFEAVDGSMAALLFCVRVCLMMG